MTAPSPSDVRARLAELAAAHAAATPGEWGHANDPRIDGFVNLDALTRVDGARIWSGIGCALPSDAAAIVAEHNVFPKLLAFAAAICDLADEFERVAKAAPILTGAAVAADRIRTTIAAHLTPGETR